MRTKKFINKVRLEEIMAPVNLDQQIRFINHLPSRPYCTEDLKQGTEIRDLDQGICYPYIQMNQHRKSYIVIDIDIKNSAFLWQDLDLPEPTIICVSPITTHCHYFYELKNGTLFPKSNSENNNYSRKAMKLFEATCRSLTRKIGGDVAYNGFIAKNPLHPFWITRWADTNYDFSFFSEHIDIDWSFLKSEESDYECIESRNCSIFNTARKLTYSIVHPDISRDEIYEFVYTTVNELNKRYAEKLPQGELRTITNSITKYCFEKRSSLVLKKSKDILPKNEIKSRQKKSAIDTNTSQKHNTKQKIENCITEFKNQKKKINISSIAKNIGMNRSYLSTEYSNFIKQLV
jgi:hypothetical protein